MNSKYFRNFIILFSIIVGSPIALYFYASAYGTTFHVSPEITVDREKIHYIGVTRRMGTAPIAPVDHAISLSEPNVVKPSSTIEVYFVDKPSSVYVEMWFNGQLIEETKRIRKKKEFNIIAPLEEGVYIYKLNPRWDFRNRVDIVFALEVKN